MRSLFLATILIAAPAAAQNVQAPVAAPTGKAAPGDDARARLIAADADRDGRWSLAEWLAAGRRERGFTFIDGDRDGFITAAELRAGMARLRQMGFAPGS